MYSGLKIFLPVHQWAVAAQASQSHFLEEKRDKIFYRGGGKTLKTLSVLITLTGKYSFFLVSLMLEGVRGKVA